MQNNGYNGKGILTFAIFFFIITSARYVGGEFKEMATLERHNY